VQPPVLQLPPCQREPFAEHIRAQAEVLSSAFPHLKWNHGSAAACLRGVDEATPYCHALCRSAFSTLLNMKVHWITGFCCVPLRKNPCSLGPESSFSEKKCGLRCLACCGAAAETWPPTVQGPVGRCPTFHKSPPACICSRGGSCVAQRSVAPTSLYGPHKAQDHFHLVASQRRSQ